MLHGSCYCDAVNFTIDADLDSVAAAGVACHCITCQKLHSSHSYNLQSTVGALKVTKGTPAVFLDTKADSTKVISRYACGACFSALYSVPDAMPGVLFVKVGSLAEASKIKPMAEIYLESALPHAPLDRKLHGVKHFEGFMKKEIV